MSKMDDKQKQTIKDLLETQKIAKIGTWRLDLASNQVSWSEELYRISGLDPSLPAPSSADHMKLFTPEDWNRLSIAHAQAVEQGLPYDLELETVKPDGSHGWMWVRAEAERDESGKIVSIWGAAQDITGHKRIEEELRRSEERFQLLFDKAPLGYQSLDVNGFFLEVNQKWLDTLGYTREEVLGKWFGDFLCPEYVDGFRDRFPIFKAQGFIHSEFEMLNKSGQRLFIAFDGKIGYSLNGDFRQTHCILQDITKQKAAEKALQDSEERFKCLFDNSGVGIGSFTPEGILVAFNKKAAEYMGGKPEDFVGLSMRDLVPKEESEKYFSRIEKALCSESPLEYEDRLDMKAGSKWFVSTYARVKNTDGEIIGVQVASLDITDRKQAQQALFESQATLETAFENSQAGIVITDAPDGRLRYVNKAGLLIGNITDEDLANNINGSNFEDIWSILHFDGTPFEPEDVPLIKALRCGEAFSEDFIIRRHGFEIRRHGFEDRYVVSNSTPLRDTSGEVTSAMVIFIDVTDKKQAEDVIRKQNELFASLLKLLPVGRVS